MVPTKKPKYQMGLLWLTLAIARLCMQEAAGQGIRNIGQALTAEQWSGQKKCATQQSNASQWSDKLPFTNIWSKLMDESCNKDAQAWRFYYIDELIGDFNHQVRDERADERLANILNMISLGEVFDTSYMYFRSGDAAQDERNELLVAGPQVSDSECSRDLRVLLSQFREYQRALELWRKAGYNAKSENGTMRLDERFVRLVRVLDSYGRYESGAFDGKMRMPGDYDECQTTQLLDNSGEAATAVAATNARVVPMRYCWANLNSDRDLNPQLKQRVRYSHETAPGLLGAGVCLPRTCHSRNFHRQEHKELVSELIKSQFRLPQTIYVEQTYETDSVFCLVDSDSQYGRLPTSGKLFLLFAASWTVLCTAITLINKCSGLPVDNQKARSFPQRLRCHLDLAQSWRDFTSDQRQVHADQSVNLDALNPVKFGAALLCLAFHTMFLLGSVATSIVQVGTIVDTKAIFQGSSMTTVVLDTFFVISAFLGTYISLVKLARHDERRAQSHLGLMVRDSQPAACNSQTLASLAGQWIAMAANRYLRIVPLYAIMFWFRRDVMTFLGWGPFWDYGLNRDTMNGACLQEPWYMPLTFLTVFAWPTRQCFMPVWSVGLDMLFGLFLLPPIVLGFRWKPRLTIQALVALTGACSLAAIEAYTTAEPAGVRWELFDARISGMASLFTSFNYLYSWPVYRFPALFMGNLAGFFLYRYAHGTGQKSTESTWPAWFAGPASLAAGLYIVLHGLVSIYTYEIKLAISPYHRLLALYVFTVDRAVWSLANGVLFLRMTTDWRLSRPMLWFSNQTWRSLAKLSYPIIFVHWIIILCLLGSQTAPLPFNFWTIFSTVSTVTLITLPASLLVHVLFENPLDKIIKREILRS